MIVLRYILGFLFLGGCWHAGALALRRVSEHA